MKKLLIIALLITCLSSFGQVITTKIVKVANSTTTFNENLVKDIEILDVTTKKIYLTLKTIASTKSISTCAIDVDLKELGSGSTPIDNILHWDGTAYSPYLALQTSYVPYPYFYTGSDLPEASFNLNIAAYVKSPEFQAITGYGPDYNQAIISPSTASFQQHTSTGVASQMDLTTIPDVGNESAWITTNMSRGSSKSIPIYLGSTTNAGNYHNQYIKVDDYKKTFTVDMDTIKFKRGTANKFLKLDASKNISYVDAPGSTVLASGGLHLDGDTAKLGGTTHENTDINIGSNSFNIHNLGLDFSMNGDALKLSSGYINVDPNQGYLDINAGEASFTARSNNSEVNVVAYADYAAGLTYHSVGSGDNYNSNLYMQQDTAKLQVEKNNKYFSRLSNHEIETSIFHRYYAGLSIHNYSGTISGSSTGIRYTRIPESSFQDSTLVTKHYIDRKVISGSVSVSTTSTTSLTITIGQTMVNTTYKVCVTPTSSIAAVPFYVTSKSTTQFVVTYLTPSTGYVSFDWILTP